MDYTKYCSITYDGKLLDQLLPGYTTINVEGRGLTSPLLKTIDIDGADGSYIESQNMPSRQIIVHFHVKADNNAERLQIVEDLNLLLLTDKDVQVSFGDQQGYFIGRFTDAVDIPFDYFTGIGTYTIYCQNPYRHMPLSTYSGSSITITDTKYKKLILEEVSFYSSSMSLVELRNANTAERISLKSLPTTGQIKITKDSITLSGQSIVSYLDASISTWKAFKINTSDTLSIVGASGSITWKVRKLL